MTGVDPSTKYEKGRVFTRNVAMAFDLRMMRKMPETRLFSMTV
jgi:oxygen-independent coproporphyrinogen-3 oxidase